VGIEKRCVTSVTNMSDCVKDTIMNSMATEYKTMLQGLQGRKVSSYNYSASFSLSRVNGWGYILTILFAYSYFDPFCASVTCIIIFSCFCSY